MARDAGARDPNRDCIEEQRESRAGIDRRDFIKAGATLGLAVGAGHLGVAEAQPGPKKGGTLVKVVQPEPPTLASYANTSGPIGQVAPKVYDGLVEYDFKMNPLPGLAKSWTVAPGGKSVTFKLQEGVTFHDGKPFPSADVKNRVL